MYSKIALTSENMVSTEVFIVFSPWSLWTLW